MSRISNAFKNGKAFIAFLTGGDPGLDKSAEFILELERAGTDIIEIGIPFSDPVAEGPVIEAANIRALKNNVTVRDIFALVKKVRETSEVPLVLLTYLNPVYFFGYEEFFAECKSVGVDGIIIPDLPFEESREVGDVADKYGVDLVSLIAPTSNERIEMIARNAKGFLYLVSSLGVTGVRKKIKTDVESVVNAVKKVSDVPVAVGFGISNAEQASELARYSDGVIVGSAIVEIIAKHGENAAAHLCSFVKEIKAVM
ncbi:MAG: tryptophan synthase subunit alpha [Oscillospiraceae bacterium]|nr:tryptophan synthase subunit alpha [Oscillospiraceae bacterium]